MNAIIELKDIKRDFLVGNETVHALRGVSFNSIIAFIVCELLSY